MRWSCHLMQFVCLCCVMPRYDMLRHVMCAHVKSCHLLCPAIGWNVMSLKRHYSLSNSSVLQSTTPVQLRTTKYYSSTTLYYKVLLQYYSVLQSTTPVLQSTAPVLLCTTKYYYQRRAHRIYFLYLNQLEYDDFPKIFQDS